MNPARVRALMAQPPPPDPPDTGPEPPYALHLFVCTSGPDCPVDGPALEIRKTLKAEIKARGLADQVRVNHSGCLGQCGHGPMLVVYPEGAWYAHLDVERALRVLHAHLDREPRRVMDLRYRLGPGGNKAPADGTGKRHCDRSCLHATRRTV